MGAVRILVPVLAVSFGLTACSHAKKAPPPAPLPVHLPLVAFEAVKVEGLGFSGARLSFRARAENTGPTPISVVRIDYALDLEGGRAAQGTTPAALAIAGATAGAPGVATVVLPIELRFATVPGIARVLAADREAAYALSGAVTFLTPEGEVRVPMGHSGRLVVPRAPRFGVEKVLLRSASPREIALEMRMEVRNPNDFELPAGRIGCGLVLSGKEVVRADLEIPEPIVAGGSAAVTVPLRISVLKAGKAAARMLIPFTSLDVAVKGEAQFGGVPVPLDLATSILPGS
jgi:LEA14-like dessication related protein